MGKPSEGSLPPHLPGRLVSHLYAKIAPILVARMPERYYALYRQRVAWRAAQIAPWPGSPDMVFERDYVLPLIAAADGGEGPVGVLDALAKSPHMLLLGVAGSGKSTLLGFLAWYLATRQDPSFVHHLTFRLFGQALDDLMPLLVDLGEWTASGGNLEGAFLSAMSAHGFPAGDGFLRQRLEAGQCVLLLDGLEHVHTAAQRAEIAALVSTYPRNLWVITSRPPETAPRLEPPTLAADLPGFATYQLQGMDDSQMASFFSRHLTSPLAAGLLAACERNEELAQLARIPLMAASMCRALRQQAARAVKSPLLVGACLQTLRGRPASRPVARQEGAFADELPLLQRLAYQMQAQGQPVGYNALMRLAREQFPEATLEALTSLYAGLIRQAGILCPVGSEQTYAFALPALQSYLAALWLVDNGQTDALLPLADERRWQPVIVLVAGLLPDAAPFLARLAAHSQKEPDKWLLLARCIAEIDDCDCALRSQVEGRLLALLEEESSDYWRLAVQALAGMAGRPVREHLRLQLWDTSAETRRRAAWILGKLQQESSIPALETALTDPAEEVRRQAAWALGQIPSAKALRALAQALSSPKGDVAAAAAQSLAALAQAPALLPTITHQLFALLADERGDISARAEEALLAIGPTAMAELVAGLNDRRSRPDQRFRLARVMGHLGDARAVPTLIDAILDGQNSELAGYLEAIATIGPGALPGLIQALADKEAHAAPTLIMALARIGAPAIEPLTEALAGSAETRGAARDALKQIGAPAIEALTQTLLHDARFEVRGRALEILKETGDGVVVSRLADALAEGDPATRLNIVRYMGELGTEDAAQPLTQVLRTATDPGLQRAALASLGAIGNIRDTQPLLEALENPSLRDVASDVLAGLGEPLVETLVHQLHTPALPAELGQAIWDVIAKIATGAPADVAGRLTLAATYARLRDERLTPDEILALTRQLAWWKHGPELYRSLATAQALEAASDLEAIAKGGGHLGWLAGQEEWLRPQVKEILWGLDDIVENIRPYRRITQRESQREALLTCSGRLLDLERRIQEATLPFERVFLEGVTRQWHAVMAEALQQIRGRASLAIELLTPTLPLRDTQHVATAVFRLFNEGDSPARNLVAAIRPGAMYSAQVLGGTQRDLDPLGVGEERYLEVNLVPDGSDRAELLFEVRYDDEEREGVTHQFSCQLAFLEVPALYMPIEDSPYIAGTPVKTPEMFFGRHDVFDWVRENIQGKHQQNALVLYGERRIGKTSVLYQLQQRPPTPQHLCVLFDLQLYSYISTMQELLWELATAIIRRLDAAGLALPRPEWSAFETNPFQAFLDLSNLLDSRLDDRRVVVMMDEFGVLLAQIRDGVLDVSVLDFLRGVIQRANKLTFLFTGAHEMRRLQQELRSTLFNTAKVQRITYLSLGEATDLIVKPVEGLLTYHPLVVQRIRAVTACHPYFIQYICDDLVQLARAEHKNYVEPSDLEYVLHAVVQDATGNIEGNVYHFLDNAERLALAALAAITDEARVFVPFGDIIGMLERRHLSLPKTRLMRALQGLKERELVTERRIGHQLYYAFRMGLVRMWLRQNEILLRLSQEQEP